MVIPNRAFGEITWKRGECADSIGHPDLVLEIHHHHDLEPTLSQLVHTTRTRFSILLLSVRMAADPIQHL